MKISRQNDQYQLLVSRDELGTLGNCVLEALENLDHAEFETRVGESVSNVKAFLEQIVKAYRDS